MLKQQFSFQTIFFLPRESTTSDILAAKVWLFGALQCGTEEAPYGGSFNITLNGQNIGCSDRVGGDKSLAVFSGAVLSLHGKKLSSWTRLAATAGTGTNQVSLFDDVDWTVGDKVVIDYHNLVLRKQAEVEPISGRNIIIQGDVSSQTSQFGAHVMVMRGGRAYVSGVEFFQTGISFSFF